VTPKTLRTRDALLADLAAIRTKGFAVENEECDLDVRSVAAPVRDFSKNVIAAVGIVAPVTRLSDERIERDEIAARVRDAAVAISAKLGYLHAPPRALTGSI